MRYAETSQKPTRIATFAGLAVWKQEYGIVIHGMPKDEVTICDFVTHFDWLWMGTQADHIFKNATCVERRRRWKSDTSGFCNCWKWFWKGDTNLINNYFVLDVSVRFSVNRPVRSHLVGDEFKYMPFVQELEGSLFRRQLCIDGTMSVVVASRPHSTSLLLWTSCVANDFYKPKINHARNI